MGFLLLDLDGSIDKVVVESRIYWSRLAKNPLILRETRGPWRPVAPGARELTTFFCLPGGPANVTGVWSRPGKACQRSVQAPDALKVASKSGLLLTYCSSIRTYCCPLAEPFNMTGLSWWHPLELNMRRTGPHIPQAWHPL